MVSVDRVTPIRFLRTAYNAADWIAVFLKTYRTGDVAQRVMPVSVVLSQHFQAWLRQRNANGWNVYVSVNAVVPNGPPAPLKGSVATPSSCAATTLIHAPR